MSAPLQEGAVGAHAELPCAGLSVVELAVGVSDLGLGLAGGVPGMLLADLGASVVRVVGRRPPPIDTDVAWGRAWHRDKRIVPDDDVDEVRALLRDADVALVYGSEAAVEGRGLGYVDLRAVSPRLVYARCRASRTSKGAAADFSMLVEARAGLFTQLAGHRSGPIFVDARASQAGTTFILLTTVLALLGRRERTGAGGWSETSLYDGMLATLGAMVGRSERAAPHIERTWATGSTFPNFVYRCADGELIQVWFGGKGMYPSLIEVLGDEPSAEGYYKDQVNGMLNERAVRWRSLFATHGRDHWVRLLREAGVACEPVLLPGQVLSDPHLAEIGLAVPRSEGAHRDIVVGNPISVVPLGTPGSTSKATARGDAPPVPARTGLLGGLHVLDFSAFVAGPLGAQVLADMGAEVIKVEPLEGEAMRAAAYAVAACQRGKRSLALDLHAEGAGPVVERLIRWADVILHNFRVGVSARLGIDEETVARINPNAVYCHASAFGTKGPRATFPGNDALMQAVTGLELAVGGVGNDPLAPSWIPIDMSGGWLGAAGILAGLYARARTGDGQLVLTSLLGAGMLLQSGVFQRDGYCVREPELDAKQTGYGPGYRIYECADGNWLALVVPDADSWQRLRSMPEVADLPETYVALRGGAHDAAALEAEAALERAFATAPADKWVARLRGAGVPLEPIAPLDRDGFRQGILDDPLNRQLGRVVAFETADWGRFEQIGPLVRCGPSAGGGPPLMLPGIGEHTVDVLTDLGFGAPEIDALIEDKVVRQLQERAARRDVPYEGKTLMGGRVDGKVAIVTGAGTSAPGVGTGKAISVTLAREGASVLLVDMFPERAEETLGLIQEAGGTGLVFKADITRSQECKAMVSAAVERFDGVDILVNNAAITRHNSILDTSDELYESVVGVNLRGAFMSSKYAIPEIVKRGGGSIVNIGSVASIRDSGSSHPAYAASKAALLGLTVDLAGEYGPDNVRVNAVLPGMIVTPMAQSVSTRAGSGGSNLRGVNMLGRRGDAWDIVNAVLFLCSDEGSYITAVTLPVDGGAVMGMPSSHALRAGG